jgi:DNA-binding transcriptional regulator GbsR (MarR family)
MGTLWGVNRTVAQVHALLFISPSPLTAEAITDALGVARSNVSNSLKELQNWGIVRRVHLPGDRRDYFESIQDVWAMFLQVVAERKRREVDPTLEVLKECVHEADKDSEQDPFVRQQLGELLKFMETTTGWYEQVRAWSPQTIARVATLGDKALKLFGQANIENERGEKK